MYTLLYSMICLSCCKKLDTGYAKIQLMYDSLIKDSAVQEILGGYSILTQILPNLQWGRQGTSVMYKMLLVTVYV